MTEEDKPENYKSTIDVRATPGKAYEALVREMSHWWSTEIEGSLDRTGQKVTVSFPPNNGAWTFEATKLVDGKLIELRCVDAYHVVAGQPAEIEKEWLDTTLRWVIVPHNDGARIMFEHKGLTPELFCFDICHEGWDFFFGRSLSAYLNDGTGLPHTP